MRKILFSLIAVIGAVWAFALSGLFPDTPAFPRIPIGTGTIGNVIAKILGTTSFELSNGMVVNTEYFSGIAGSGYLHIGNCWNPSEVWIKVDANGGPVCGLQKPVLAFGNIETTSGSVVVIRYSDGSNVPGIPGLPLFAGDIVITETGSATEIGFPSDNSILRLDELTNVELQFGTFGGNTVAQAILNDGSLWGRVLTSTGVNLGGGSYIAWVRGTSISANVHPNMSANFVVPHSIYPTNAVTYTNLTTQSSLTEGTGQALMAMLFTWAQDAVDIALRYGWQMVQPADMLYMANPWIRENTKKDIVYLNELANSGNINSHERTRAQNELAVTLPSQWKQDCLNLITGPTADEDETIEGAVTSYVCNHPITADAVACGVQNKILWPFLAWTNIDVCQPINGVAIADFVNEIYMVWMTHIVSPLRWTGWYQSTDQAMPHWTITPSWLKIDTPGTWLEYVSSWLNLAGKTIKIELDAPAGSLSGTATAGAKFYVADLGWSLDKFFVWKGKNCAGWASTWNYLCKSWSTWNRMDATNETNLILTGITSPSQLIIGNIWLPLAPASHLKAPISTTIKEITISN